MILKTLKKLVSKSCPTANHWYTQLMIRQKALRRRPTRTSKSSNYVGCWKMKDKLELITLNKKAWRPSVLGILKYLMRSVYRSEKQMHNDHKLITQDEKAWWQVRLESSKFQGSLMRCFRATVNRVRTRFLKETEVTNQETDSRGVFILFSNLLTRQMLGNLFLMETRDHLFNQARSELVEQEHRVGSLDSCIDELQQQACAQRLEFARRSPRIFWISKRTITPARRIIYEGKSASRNSDTKKNRGWERMKKAQELRVDEFSVQTLRESHETIQRLTSQMQEMQEQMNSMNDTRGTSRSGIESQWEIVLRSQSTSSDSKFLFHAEPRQNACQLLQENIFVNQFSTLDSSRNRYQRIHVIQDRFQCILIQELLSQEMKI